MAMTFKIVIVLIASLQLAHLASLSTNNDDNINIPRLLKRKHLGLHIPSKLHSKKSVNHAKHVPSNHASEKNNLNLDHGSDTKLRLKRQLEEDAGSDVEIMSNNPKMFSYGTSMNMTSMDHQDVKESDIWNEDIDSTDKNSLVALADKNTEESETSMEELSAEVSSGDSQASSFKSPPQDISTADRAPRLEVMAPGEDHLEGSSSHTEQNPNNVHIVPTVLYDATDIKPVPGDEELKEENAFENEEKDSGVNDNTESRSAEGQVEKMMMDTDGAGTYNGDRHSNEDATLKKDSSSHDSKESHEKGVLADMLSKEVEIDDNERAQSDNIDKDDIDTFLPLDNTNDKTNMGQLKQYDSELEEGSGDMDDENTGSLETKNKSGIDATLGSGNNNSVEISVTEDSNNFNIDSDIDRSNEEKEEENKMIEEKDNVPIPDPTEISLKAVEPSKTFSLLDEDNEDDAAELEEDEDKDVETPIPDPTNISSIEDDTSKRFSISEDETEKDEVPIPDPTEEPSKIDDPSQTYDPTKVIDPLGFEKTHDAAKALIIKVLGIEKSEETADGTDLEGSGLFIENNDGENDGNSLEDDGMFTAIDGRLPDEESKNDNDDEITTEKPDEGVTEILAIARNAGKLNAVLGDPSDSLATQHVGNNTAVLDVTSKEKEEMTLPPGMDDRPSEGPLLVPDLGSDVRGRQMALPSPSSINEMGVNKGENVASTDKEDDTSTSSTGSFIVLGAIMATIVVLLGYSVVKSRKQKQNQRALQRSKEDEPGTELKQIEPLLSGMNGQGPANRLTAENDRLLSPDDHRDNPYPMYKNGINGENGIANGQPTKVSQVENPDDLREVKVNELESSPKANGAETPPFSLNMDDVFPLVAVKKSNTSNAPMSNGLGVKNPPESSDQDDTPQAPELRQKDDRGSSVYGTQPQPERAMIKTFIDHDSIPKTPIVIETRGNEVRM